MVLTTESRRQVSRAPTSVATARRAYSSRTLYFHVTYIYICVFLPFAYVLGPSYIFALLLLVVYAQSQTPLALTTHSSLFFHTRISHSPSCSCICIGYGTRLLDTNMISNGWQVARAHNEALKTLPALFRAGIAAGLPLPKPYMW